ncbi:hypothetical protein [Nostoc sp.]|uniref:hypothetical protein n=1 Tax=Nostoc sp. TaxID=1180 RepID=UPI002FF9C411
MSQNSFVSEALSQYRVSSEDSQLSIPEGHLLLLSPLSPVISPLSYDLPQN